MSRVLAALDSRRFGAWFAVIVFAVAAVGPVYAACCCADNVQEPVAEAVEVTVPSCHHEPKPEQQSDPQVSVDQGTCLCLDHSTPDATAPLATILDRPANDRVQLAVASSASSVDQFQLVTWDLHRTPIPIPERAFVRHCAFLI